MDLSLIVESVVTLFIIMLVGVYGSKKKIITEEINKALIDILLKIALPFMIVSSFIYTYDNTIKDNVVKTFYYSFAAYIIMALLSYGFLLPVKGHKKAVLHFANVFTNTGYVGFPILHSIYGAEGVVYGSVFNMFFVLFVWTYGQLIFQGSFHRKNLGTEIKKILFNPSIIALFIGIAIMLLDIQLPRILLPSIRSIGNMTGPLSMMIIGAVLAKVKPKKYIRDWTLYYGIIIKLILIPFIIYCIAFIIGQPSKAMNTVIIMTAMPSAAMTSILAEAFNREKDFAAVVVSATTLLSLITIPILLKIII